MRCAPGRRGVVLLEVVLSLALFFMASLVVLAGLNAALRTAQRVQLTAEASDLAVSLLSEVHMGLVPPLDDGPNVYEDERLVDWTWEIATERVEETLALDLPELVRVEVIIRHAPSGYVYRIGELVTDEPLDEQVPVEEMPYGGMEAAL